MEPLESIRQLATTKAYQTLRQDTEIQMVVLFVQGYGSQNDIEPKRFCEFSWSRNGGSALHRTGNSSGVQSQDPRQLRSMGWRFSISGLLPRWPSGSFPDTGRCKHPMAERQFEYTWLRTVGRQNADFGQVAEQAAGVLLQISKAGAFLNIIQRETRSIDSKKEIQRQW